MKVARILVAFLFSTSAINGGAVMANVKEIPYEVPKLVTFSVSRESIDVGTSPVELTFNLTVSHPVGIVSTRTNLNFISQDGRISLTTPLIRQGDLTFSEQPVLFSGTLKLDSSIPTGLYNFYAESIQGARGPLYRASPISPQFYPPKFSSFLNGEASVQVRKFGKLELTNKTFVGPSYQSNSYLEDSSPVIYTDRVPIFRVFEIYDPRDYFVIRVPNTRLLIETFTPQICEVVDTKLYFRSSGNCKYRVFSEPTNNYQSTSITLESEILGKRTKPIISPPTISDQKASNLPKEIESFVVRDNLGRLASITNNSPEICFSNNRFSTLIGVQIISVISGGTCVITYETPESGEYLPSGPYQLKFTVQKQLQEISINLPRSIKFEPQSLSLEPTSSSKLPVIAKSQTPKICEVVSNTLKIILPGTCILNFIQSGTPNFESAFESVSIEVTDDPVKPKSIKCRNIKNKKIKKFIETSCPKGFKLI